MSTFPIIKLARAAIKFISTPLANKAKEKAKESPFFRKYICIPPANLYHWCEAKMSMLSKNITGKAVYIPPLPETKAIELGANLVGDAVVFTVGSSIFVLEYFRRSHKEQEKATFEAKRMHLVFDDLQTLYVSKAELEGKVDQLIQIAEEKMDVTISLDPNCIEDGIPAHHIIEESSQFDVDPKTLVFKALDYLQLYSIA